MDSQDSARSPKAIPHKISLLFSREEMEPWVVCLVKLSSEGITHNMNQLSETTLSFDEAVMQCTNSLQSKKNPEESIRLFLKILGEYYQGASSYIFELDQDEKIFQCKYQWNTKASVEFSTVLSALPYSALDYFESDQIPGCDVPIMLFHPPNHPDPTISSFLKNIQQVLISPIVEKGRVTAFVAMTDLDFQNFEGSLFSCLVLFIQESMQKREMYLQLATLHNLDPLTGFFNETQYQKKRAETVANPPNQLGVALIQMNGLDKIVRIYGEKFVDVKVKNTSILLGEYIDQPFYRVNGEKFVCFVSDTDAPSFDRLIDKIRLEATTDKNTCFIVGHAWHDGSMALDEVIAIAEDNLAKNMKEEEKANFGTSRESLSLDLNGAIEADFFVVHLQPKVELTSMEVQGAQVLLRRFIPESQTLIPLDSFVPLYEQHEIIRVLDLHIFRKVCENLSKWRKQGLRTSISLHMNPLTLVESGVPQILLQFCQEFQIPPGDIVIVIAQRCGVAGQKIPNLVLEDYKKCGLNLDLSRDCCVYSNYLNFTKVSFQNGELDCSMNESDEEKRQKTLKKISEICDSSQDYDAKVPKELLHDLNCAHGQGYFFGQPISVDEFFGKYM